MKKIPEKIAGQITPTQVKGADLLVKTLAACGIEFIFMEKHPDTDAISEALQHIKKITLIHPVSEIACVPMADACSRFTGKPAASITAGEGHCLNQVMGLTTAWGDKSPVISIAVIKDKPVWDSPVFDRENPNLEAVFSSISVYHTTIKGVSDIKESVLRGVREAMAAKGGTVHMEIPLSILKEEKSASLEDLDVKTGAYFAQKISPPMSDPALVKQALNLLLSAERPMIFAGGGVVKSGAVEELNTFAEKMGIPVFSSMGSLDSVYPDNPMYIGPSSYTAGEAFHKAIKKADVVLAIGTCFSGLDGFGLPPIWSGNIKFIQVNIDHQYIALNPPAEVAIVADAKQVLGQMSKMAETLKALPGKNKWVSLLKKKRQDHFSRIVKEARKHKGPAIHPAAAILSVKEQIEKSNAICVVDGGNTPLWAGMLINVKGPKRVFFPTGMATLGVGIPMALAIKAACGDTPVILLSGDGSLLYHIQELELIKKYNLPITIIVNNDSAWNMIRAGEIMVNKTISTALPSQDYTKVAEAFGIEAKRVSHVEEIPSIFQQAMDKEGPMLIDIPTDKNVMPDSLASFIRVEFMGQLMPQPFKKLRRLYQSEVKLFSRNTWNILKFLAKTM